VNMMRAGKMLLLVGALSIALAGCISSTTGRARVEPNKDNAAQQYYELGARYYRAGNYTIARDRLKLALDFSPRMAIAHSTLALTYEQLEVPRLAAEHHALAVRYEPRNIDVRNNYAVFLCQNDRFDDAREQFERAAGIADNDNAETALTNAGACMMQKPDYEQAEAYFRQALARKNNHPEALLQLATLKRRTDDPLSARAFLQRFMASQPTTPAILMLAIDIENDMGDDDAREEYRMQLIEQFPSSPEARRLLRAGGTGTP